MHDNVHVPMPQDSTTGVTGAEGLRPGHLPCSLMHDMVLTPVHQFGTPGASGAT